MWKTTRRSTIRNKLGNEEEKLGVNEEYNEDK